MKTTGRSYGKVTDYSRFSRSSSFVTSQASDTSETEKTLKFETFVAQCRKNTPHLSRHPKDKQIKTEYVSRSNTVGKEAQDSPFLFDDYFTMYLDKGLEVIPDICEVKILHNYEKVLGIQCIFDTGKDRLKGPMYVGTDADLGYEEATLTLEKGDSIVEVSGYAAQCVHRLRIRTFYGQVLEVGGHSGKPFKQLFKPNYKLLFLGGSVTEQLDNVYAYF